MIETITSVALLTAVSLGPIARAAPAADPPDPLASAARAAFLGDLRSVGPESRQQTASSNDSLKNGAITGAIAGGLAVGLLAVLGCAAGGALGGDDEADCGGPVLVGAAIGAGLGALVGVGVDALFQRAPQAGRDPRGIRKGVQLRLRF